ncbi:MAG: sel1 repeat family protein, partial [Amphritea sp.]
MRLLFKLIAPLLGWCAYRIFRSSLFKKSATKHRLVMNLFRFAADNGSTQSLSVYGHLLHFRGEGLDNRIQGAIYIERAAQQGEMKAAYQMGKIYEEGFDRFGIDPAKALRYYTQAAEAGHLLGSVQLKSCYTQCPAIRS